jgi:hypothetical protein
MTATNPEEVCMRAFYAVMIVIRSITSLWGKCLFPAQKNDEQIRWTLCGKVPLRERAIAPALDATKEEAR